MKMKMLGFDEDEKTRTITGERMNDCAGQDTNIAVAGLGLVQSSLTDLQTN